MRSDFAPQGLEVNAPANPDAGGSVRNWVPHGVAVLPPGYPFQVALGGHTVFYYRRALASAPCVVFHPVLA